MKRPVLSLGIVGALVLSATPAVAQGEILDNVEVEEIPVDDLSEIEGLNAEQLAAIDSFASKGRVTEGGAARFNGDVSTASSTRRATYYRGSRLMWTRDNVDFGYNSSRVTFSSPYQQRGFIFPNIARNRGMTKYVNTTKNHRFRAKNTIGAGVVTPWGDVKVYTSDYIHRLSVNRHGGWAAWSD